MANGNAIAVLSQMGNLHRNCSISAGAITSSSSEHDHLSS